MEKPRAVIMIDGQQIGSEVWSDTADNALASQLASVWVAWTSCGTWSFAEQLRWIKRDLGGSLDQLR